MNGFLTAYGEVRKDGSIPSGQETEAKYEYKINKHGQKKLEIVGEVNVYEQIQTYAEENKLENIMARCIAGDTSVLRPDGIYGDITNLPTNLIEARQAMQNLENTWNSVPQDIKNKYNNSLDEFIAKSNTEEWQKDMGLIPTQMEETPVEKVTATETIQAHGEVNANES